MILSLNKASKITLVAKSTLHRSLKNGDLSATKTDKGWQIEGAELNRWMLPRLTQLSGRVRGLPEDSPIGIRRVGGAKLNRALVRNVRTCRSDVKGEVTSGYNREGQSTDAEHRGGAARSRVEGPVMGLDRRGCIAQPKPRANW